MRATIRVRLAACYTALTTLTGVILLGITYLFVVPELPTLMTPAVRCSERTCDQSPELVTDVVDIRSQVGESLLTWGGLGLLAVALASACVGWLLDGLLALAHSETTIDRNTRIDLAVLAADVAHTHADAARAAGVELRTALGPVPLYGDPVLLGRVVHNLVDNAVRYNVREHGWVTVHSGTERDGSVTFSVTNSGPVIAATEMDFLFEPFRRLRYDRTRQPRGSGLGLSIVRAVVRAHQGTVRAHSRQDGGLALHVTMPAHPVTDNSNGVGTSQA